MTKAEEKKAVRAEVRRAERALEDDYLVQSGEAVVRRLLTMPEYREAGTVFCFVGTGREIDTRPLLSDALARGKTLCVPLCSGDGVMELRRLCRLEALAPGAYGIPEPPADSVRISPDAVDLAVIPCLACSRSGARLGRGGGYYDRFLASYRAPAVLVCRERLVRQELPVEPHDLPVPLVLTERGLFEDGEPVRAEA